MAQPINNRADLTDQQIADVGRRIEMGAKEVDDLSALFDNDDFPENRTDVAYRVLVPQRIAADEVNSFKLRENIAPNNRSLKYATYRKTVEDYGTRHEYTAKAVEDNPDSVVTDAVEDLDGWTTDMKKFLAAGALAATHSSVAPIEVSSKVVINSTMDKAYQILTDVLESEPWAGGEYLFVVPGAVRQALKNELLALNGGNTAGILPANEQMKLVKGYVGSWGGFSLFVPKGANKILQDENNYYVYFIGKTDRGANPLRRLTKKGALTQVLHHALGSGIMKNADGEIVPDYNHQKGGIGCNLKGIAYYIRDDRFVLKCTIAKSKFNGVSITSEIPADGDDDGTVYQTLDRVIEGKGGTVSAASALTITGASAGDDIPNGSSVQLKANHDVVWSSSDTTKMVVDQTGKVTAKAASGSATISAFDGSATATISLDCAAAS